MGAVLAAATLIVPALWYWLSPDFAAGLNVAAAHLRAGDFQSLGEHLRSYGAAAAAFSAGLMVLQCLVAPIPAFPITMANGLVFGMWWGGLLALSSASVGAIICFAVARRLGRPWVEALVPAGPLASAEDFVQRYGVEAILLARLLPFVPFDPISYFAGLTALSWRRFVLATTLGQIPGTLVYAHLGSELELSPGFALRAGLIMAAVGVSGVGVLRWLRRRRQLERPD